MDARHHFKSNIRQTRVSIFIVEFKVYVNIQYNVINIFIFCFIFFFRCASPDHLKDHRFVKYYNQTNSFCESPVVEASEVNENLILV